MSSPLENIQTGEAVFQRFAAELRALGFTVNEDHGIDPITGKVVYMSVSADASVDWVAAQGVFARLSAANVLIGVGSSLRRTIWEGINNGAIKLHDFGFRGRNKGRLVLGGKS